MLCRLNQPIMKAQGIQSRLLGCRSKYMRRSARRNKALRHNNSFDRSASERVFHRELVRRGVECALGQFERSADARFSFKLCGLAAHASIE
jgi:hypothetical protein